MVSKDVISETINFILEGKIKKESSKDAILVFLINN